MKTGDDFKQAWQVNKPETWMVRSCGICGVPIGYVFHPTDGRVGFDSNCGCSVYDSGIQLRSWSDIADFYNRQTEPSIIAGMDAFWGFAEKEAK